MKWDKKQIIGLIAMLLVTAIAVGGIALWLRENKLEQLQNEALAELERDAGQYDEQSIVLYETSKAKAEELAKLYGATLRITENGRFATLTLPEGTTIRDVYAMEESRKYIDEMTADYQVQTSKHHDGEEGNHRRPSRPRYEVSDRDYELQSYLDYLNLDAVWNQYTGYGMTIAVIDTGIDTDHPEFAGRISEYSYNATEDKIVKDYNDWSLVEDEVGHGTAVTGVIAAAMDGNGTVGIAPNAEILVIKAECDMNGNFARTSDLVFGLYYAIERDVNVVNMSFGTYGCTNPFAEATQLAYDSDIICVAAAGNDSTSSLCWPAADEKVIGVGALDGWELAYYSNYGENTDVMAPGTTYTTLMGGAYGTEMGTSLASPIVAGAIALLLQNNPYTTFDDVTEVLYASCYDLGDLGRDWYYGFGALDISALVLEERGKITYDMLTDELENMEGLFIQGHTLQELPEPERLYAVFDGWYYDDTFTQEYNYYEDKFYGEVTLYAKWVNEDDGIPYTYVILDDGTVEIRSYTGHRRFITIPEMIEGRVVSSIGDFAFDGQTRLREVTLPSGLNHIGLYAFQNCANLISIQIPERVTEIEDYAFNGNVRLSTVAFLGNSKLQTIGDFAFADCGSLERIELPVSLQNINGSAFYGATALYNIAVQPGNTAFQSREGVLYNLSGSTLVVFPAAWGSSYVLPEDTQYIGEYAFAFTKLQQIDLSNVTAISDCAFVGAGLQALDIPDSVTAMGSQAFYKNENLSDLKIGRGLTEIPVKAFANSSSLRNVTIPNNIARIGVGAFSFGGLESMSFEENSQLILIREAAFYNCHISEIDIPGSVVEIGMEAFSGLCQGNPLVKVSFASDSKLQTIGAGAFAKCWLLENITLPATLQTLGDQAFMSSGLTAITIPANTTNFGAGVFAYCEGLTAIEVAKGNAAYHDIDGIVYSLDNQQIHTFPAGLAMEVYHLENTTRTIMPWAFAGTTKLGSVVIPEGLTVIGEYGLYLSGIVSVSLPETLTEIQQYAFASCVNLTSVQIPDNVLQIGRYAFAEDWSLHTVSFNETSKLPRLSYGAFAYSGITDFRVSANVSTMAQGVFEGCRNLYQITFAANSKLESISAYMFDGCSNLNSITFEPGSALTSIQAHGLEGMDNLQYIDFGDAKLTNIDNFAFRFCENLETLNLPETVTNIGRYAFYGCKRLFQLTIPAAVEHIGSYAFLGTNDMELYFVSETLPLYLDENWDHDTKGYYTGVSEVAENGDYKYAVLPSGNIAILGCLGSETTVDLTQVDLGGKITIIGGSAFEGSTVESIVLPSTLTAIQAEAFAYSNLASVTIPANVTFIGREAFAHTNIATLTFAKNSKLTVIEQYAFEGTKELTAVTLPASLTTLGSGVFLNSGLQSVTFEKGIQITEIPQQAFAETKLTSVALPDSVTLVNHNAFNNVQTLKSLTFGNNEGIRLMSNAFYRTGLETLHIPANVTYIGEYCFVALGNLTEFTVDTNNPNYKAVDGLLVSKDGRKLIAVPAGRTGSLTVPKSVEEIGFGAFEESKLSEILFHQDANILTFGYRAFFRANDITTITVPKSVVSIDYYAFAYCENLKEVIFVEGNQLKGIYEGAFCGDINLESITLPDSIVEISDFAFYGCSQITKLPISETHNLKGIYDYAFAYTGISGEFTTPDSLIDIGNYAFLGCDFTEITIPDTNKKDLVIGIGAFQDCNQLEEITLPFIGAGYEDEEISWFGYIFGAGSYEANGTYVPESLKTVTITDGLTTIGIGGFAYCAGLETIHVPHSVSVLWDDAFRDTTAEYTLTNEIIAYVLNWDGVINEVRSGHFGSGVTGTVTLSNDVESILHQAFYGCGKMERVVIPEGITSLQNNVFGFCSNLQSVVIPDSVTLIDVGAFTYCEALQEIHIPESVLEIGAGAFHGCTSLESVKLPDGLERIGASSFFWCSSLKEITIPEKITVIPDTIFTYCTSLEKVTLPESITEIQLDAFSGCSSLKAISIPEGVTTIPVNAFMGCSSLEKVDLPDSLTTIEERGFANCSRLASITIPHGVVFIGDNAFRDCHELCEVYNNCALDITLGSSDYGSVAQWAKVLVDRDQNCHYLDESSGFRIIQTAEGFRFVYEYGQYVLTSYLGEEETVTLPKEIEGNRYTLRGFSGAKNVIIPDGWTVIDPGAFAGNQQLESVLLPDTVVLIEAGAFEGCSNLSNISISNNVTHIGEGAFRDCVSLTKITIPSSVQMIGSYAFYQCTGLKSVVIPNGVMEIDTSTFTNCHSLTSVTIPESLYSIAMGAFENCSSLTSITIPDSVNRIGDNAFLGTGLKKVVVPQSVTSIGYLAFEGSVQFVFAGNNPYFKEVDGIVYNAEMTEIVLVTDRCASEIRIPDTVTCIGYSAFMGKTNIVKVVLPEGMTEICDHAFSGCTNLRSISIPSTVTSVGNYAFSECTGLTSISMPDSVTYIGFGAFISCENLVSVDMPENLEYISNGMFHYCRSLKEISLPAGIEYIDSYAFADCKSLTAITIPEGTKNIYHGVFEGCTSLTSVVLPDGLQEIGGYCFNWCENLRSIDIPSSVTSFGDFAFSGCKSLTAIEIPKGVTTIMGYTFDGCESLTNIVLPEGITCIAEGSFRMCKNLRRVVIPDSVSYIGDYAFEHCMRLDDITLPDTLISCGSAVFSGCGGLTSITLSKNMTEIPDAMFSGCSNLQTIHLPESITRIGETAFNSCAAMTRITIPASVESIGEYAFGACERLYEVYNNSGLDLTIGSEDHGLVALYAHMLLCADGTQIYREGSEDFARIETEDGFLFFRINGEYQLAAYQGEEDEITLPDNINGSAYTLYNFKGGKHIVIPEGMTEVPWSAFNGNCTIESVVIPASATDIGAYAFTGCVMLSDVYIVESVYSIDGWAFSGCISLTEIIIPEGIERIAHGAFYECYNLKSIQLPDSLLNIGWIAFEKTAIYDDVNNWHEGMLLVDDWLIAVEEDLRYLPDIANIRGVAEMAYSGCYYLKDALWGNAELPSNVETVYITSINVGTHLLQGTMTLKNVVIRDMFDASDLRHRSDLFSNVTGVTIYVESLEADLRWDDNFPGWSNGNKVIYGDQWHWVNFYDENGQLIYSEPCLNSQIIRLPIHEIAPDDKYTYEIIGWDLDGDGEVDSIPATSVVDIEAKPVVVAHQRQYRIQFADATTGTVYHEMQLPYGSVITAPANPEKMGHDFVRWAGLYDGMTVIGDTVIYASWKHHGSGHEYVDPVWVDATCTEPGYNKYTCTICGEFYGTDYTTPLGHDYQQSQVNATCTEGGYTLHDCTRCDGSYCDSFTPAVGHSYGDWIVDEKSDCAHSGKQHRVCVTCGNREDGIAPAKGHKFEEIGRDEPGCNKKGKRHLHCADCGLEIQEELPERAHKFGKRRGNKDFKEQMDKQHEDVFWGRDGEDYYFYACDDCGQVMHGKEANGGKTGTASVTCRHKDTTWTVVRQPDCAGFGMEAEICDSCGETVAVSVFGTADHNYIVVVTEPTCETEGYTTHTCSGCGDSYVTDHTDALDHDYVDGVCSRCGKLDVLLGDVNGDGKINSRDARLLLRYLAGLIGEDELEVNAADFNGDGRVNVRDARAILNHIAGMG